nr:hypothetical protein [Tanacetum cinerariifolium]
EHKNQKKSNEIYYPGFTKVIIDYFMTRKPLIPRRNKINWHYVRDDILFSTIKVVSTGGITSGMTYSSLQSRWNTKAYKEYYACAIGEVAPKPKPSASKKKGGSTSSTTPPTPIATPTPTTTVVAAPRLSAAAKDVDEQTKGRDESEGDKTDESDDDDDDDQDEAEKVNDDDDNEEEVPKINEQETTESDEGNNEATESDRESEDEETRKQEEESFDPIPQTPEESEDDDNNEEDQGLRIGKEERMQEEEEADELYLDSDAQQESSLTSSFMTNLLNPLIDPGMESIFMTGSTTVTPIPSPQSTMTPSIISTFITASQLPTPPTQIPSLDLQSLLTFASVFHFEDRVKFLEDNFSNIPGIALVEAYDADMIILDTYGESTILKRRREDDDQEGPSARSNRGSKRRREGGEHALASTSSKPATGSAYTSTTWSQSRQLSASESAFVEEPVQTTCQMEEPSYSVFETGAEDQPTIQTTQHPEWFSQPRRPPTPNRDWNKSVSAAQGNTQSWISALARQTDACSSFNELLDTLIDFSKFIMNRLGVDTLTPELLVGPTYELIRGSCNSLIELEYHLEEVYKATTDQLDWVPRRSTVST